MKYFFLSFLVLGAWSLGIALGAPFQPANPYPSNLATNIPANAALTWTPGDMELIVNGTFETGNFTGWHRVNGGGFGGGANNNTYINDGRRIAFRPATTNDPPFAGNYCAVTDQDGPGFISMYQDVAVPAGVGSVWLTWADQIHNFFNTFVVEGAQQLQEYHVELRNVNNTVLTTIYRTEPGDPVWTAWNKRSFDLTPYKGQTVRIAFIEEQWQNFFHVYYDNISVRIRDTGLVSYDVFFGTNSVPGSNEFRGTVNSGSFAPPPLLPRTTYFWRVDARFGTNVFAGSVWRFTTAPIGPVDHFTWDPILSTQAPAQPFNASVTARDAFENVVTNFAGAALVTARTVENMETYPLYSSLSSSAYSTFENATVGYSFTPNTDLIVTSFNSAGKASLWTDDGILIGTHPPIHLRAGRTYRLGMYSPGTVTNHLRFDGPSTFPHGTLNQAYEGTGDAFPTRPHPARWWQLSLGYVVPTLSSAIISQSVQFTAGSWNGSISIPSTGVIQLDASDDTGVTGKANLFLVADQIHVQIARSTAGELVLRFNSIAGVAYTIQTSQDLNAWAPVTTVYGSGGMIEWPFTSGENAAFFRVFR